MQGKLPISMTIPVARLTLGLGQGLLLFAIYQCAKHDVWPATMPYLLFPLFAVLFFMPLVAIVGLGNLRSRTLVTWSGILAALLIGLFVYFVYKYDPGMAAFTFRGPDQQGFIPLMFALTAALFIGYTLLLTRDSKSLAFYPSHFDFGWKNAIQIVAAILFALAFWLLLFLGQALFKLVGLDPFKHFMQEAWFAIPATTLVIAGSLHITDVRPAIISGIRTLALTLLSWLLPIITFITTAFLLVLPSTGLSLLWDTGHASAVLLGVATVLIILINAAYQDGTPEHTPARVLRYATNVAAVALTPLTLITAYALFLRIDQYGWTVDRIIAATYAALALGYAIGYGWAVLRPGPWMAFLERCNVVMAFATIAAIVLLFSPIVDPARIAVASQMSRFAVGQIAPDKLDVKYLRFDTGRYGIAALQKLRDGGQIDDKLKGRIVIALAATNRWEAGADRVTVPKDLEIAPQGKTLPESFAQQDWGTVNGPTAYLLPKCMLRASETCRALIIDLDGDAVDEVVLLPDKYSVADVFRLGDDGRWSEVGTISHLACEDLRDALSHGEARPVATKWRDIMIGDQRMEFRPYLNNDSCVKGADK